MPPTRSDRADPGHGAPEEADRWAVQASRRASVGFVVRRGPVVVWANEAARMLVADYRGDWTGPASGSLLEALSTVPVDTSRTGVRWTAGCGATRWWDVTCRRMDGGALLYEILDATDRHADGSRTRPAEWRLARLEALARMGTWEWDLADDAVEWSDALLRLFGLPDGHRLDYLEYRSLLHPDDVPMIEQTLADALATGSPFTYTHRMHLADRTTLRVFECYGEVITDAGGTPLRVIGTARDVTERHQAERELAFLAGHDPLTGLVNRRGITDRLAECAAGRTGGALLLIDIDHFKDVNDVRGHAVGDHVMRAVARLLTAALEPGTLVGRLGGDEFAVVLPGVALCTAAEIGERLCDSVARTPVVHDDTLLRVTASIGVAVVAPRGDPEVALAHADLALYEAKNAGRNRARVFAADQYRQAVHRVSVLQRVGDALDNGALQLQAQPIVGLAPGAPGAAHAQGDRYELLVRLRDGQTPALQPAQFLVAAERTGLVLRLDRWVITQAVRALAAPEARSRRLRLEVNVSARSVDDPELGDWILGALAAADVEPARLGIEITETAAITGLDAARRLATTLTAAGCGFALDDFGAGFGSFSYLKHLPFTAVKIAGEFVRHVDTEPVDRALVDSVVRVAHELGMSTVAEHVDRAELLPALRRLGVDHGQGFLLGRPRPLTDLLAPVRPGAGG